MGGLLHLEQPGGLKDDTLKHLLTYQCRGEGGCAWNGITTRCSMLC